MAQDTKNINEDREEPLSVGNVVVPAGIQMLQLKSIMRLEDLE